MFSFGILVWDEGTASVNNPLRYNELRNHVGYNKYIAHFPQILSKDVLEKGTTVFYYCPQFLQGGFCFDLLIECSDEEIDYYTNKYEQKAVQVLNYSSEDYWKVDTFGYPYQFFEEYERNN